MAAKRYNAESDAAIDIVLGLTSSEDQKLAAAQTYARLSLSRVEQAIFAASLTAMKDKARQEGFLEGLRHRPAINVENMIMSTKTNSDNQGSVIAGNGSAASSNTGQQQGVNVGPGTAIVTNSSLGNTSGPTDNFDAAVFHSEITEVLYMMGDKIADLEREQSGLVAQAMSDFKKVNLASANTMMDAHQMLEDLWDEAMKQKYSPLRELFSTGAMKNVSQVAPTVISLLFRLLGMSLGTDTPTREG